MKHAFVKFDEADQIVDFVRIITRSLILFGSLPGMDMMRT